MAVKVAMDEMVNKVLQAEKVKTQRGSFGFTLAMGNAVKAGDRARMETMGKMPAMVVMAVA